MSSLLKPSPWNKSKNNAHHRGRVLPPGVTSKDIILHIIGVIGTAGGTGSHIEYAGEAIRDLGMEARMTICNMSIEAGARGGIIAPDEKTYEYIKGRPLTPRDELWDQAMEYWQTLKSDAAATVRCRGGDPGRGYQPDCDLGNQSTGGRFNHWIRPPSLRGYPTPSTTTCSRCWNTKA